MVKFNFEDHMKGFVDGTVAIQCKTKDKAETLFNVLRDLGVVWNNKKELTLNTQWDTYKEHTCYLYYDGLILDVNYNDNGCSMVEF